MLQGLNLNSLLKGVNLTNLKSLGSTLLTGLSGLSKRKVNIAGYSVSPLVLGGAAAAALGGYMLSRRGSSKQVATQPLHNNTHSNMQAQNFPIK